MTIDIDTVNEWIMENKVTAPTNTAATVTHGMVGQVFTPTAAINCYIILLYIAY